MNVSGKQPHATSNNLLNAALRRYEHRIILAGNHDIAFRNQATIRIENSMVVLTWFVRCGDQLVTIALGLRVSFEFQSANALLLPQGSEPLTGSTLCK